MRMEQSIHRWESRFAALLSFFPRDFRKEYAPLSLQLFSDLLHDAYRERPQYAKALIGKMFLEAAADLVREQSKSLINKLTRKKRPMSNPPAPFYVRKRMPLGIGSGIVVALAIASLVTGFWGYNGPVAYFGRAIGTGMQIEKVGQSNNYGQADVAANFVNDYVQAKYYGDKRTDVGLNSIHADQAHVIKFMGRSYQQGLELDTKRLYETMQPDFDMLTCSTQAPTSVHFRDAENGAIGYTSVVAEFRYANSSTINEVTYNLRLDQSRSTVGTWKVSQVVCTSLNEQQDKPYTLSNSSVQTQEYLNRNDKTYVLAQ